MSRRRWDGAPGPTDAVPEAPTSVLVSLHYLRAALRRRWRVWAGLGAAGFLLGILATVVIPAASVGRTTVILAHDPAVEPSLAMATDMRLLGTRTVAERVIDELGLDMTPEDFQETTKVEPLTSDVLTISVYAADDAAATERVQSLTEVFMAFRADQIEAQSKAIVDGYSDRVAALERQSERLTQQFDTVASSPADDNSQAADLLAQRAQADEQIGQIQEQIAETELESGAIVQASRVLDEASPLPRHPLRRTALAGLSGLVGGMAVGIGLVLVVAITSDRLRRREDVSRALGVPVRSGVGGIRPSPWAPWRHSRADRARSLLVHAVESALPAAPARPVRMALAAVDNVADAAYLLAALGVDLVRHGVPVLLVDLSRSGDLQEAVDGLRATEQTVGTEEAGDGTDARADVLPQTASELERAVALQPDTALRAAAELRADALLRTALALKEGDEVVRAATVDHRNGDPGHRPAAPSYDASWPVVYRSDESAELARGPLGGVDAPVDLGEDDPHRVWWDRAEVVLTLVEVAPDGGLEALSSWADQAVPIVTAGASSAERLRTTAELVRAAGLELPFAVMIGCDPTDESIGFEATTEDQPVTARSTE